jgi:hypothetical protein
LALVTYGYFNTFGVNFLNTIWYFFVLKKMYFVVLLRAFGVHLCNWLSVAKLGIGQEIQCIPEAGFFLF